MDENYHKIKQLLNDLESNYSPNNFTMHVTTQVVILLESAIKFSQKKD